MTKVDTWFNGYDIYVDNNGMYYVCHCGEIVSPAYATLRDAQRMGKIYVKD